MEPLAALDLPWSDPLDGLPLTRATDPRWTEVALAHLDELLVDHALCEQKAASAALALIGRFPDRPELARPMTALAHEELHHFRQVLDLIESRGGALTRPRPDRYVHELRQRGFRTAAGLGAYGDLLLVNAFVEARSCERFRLLAAALLEPGHALPTEIPDREALGHFYRVLAQSEGRHWETFRDLARVALPAAKVARRIALLAEVEAEIIAERPLLPAMH
jgi:tRNA-(ms[2]io[6]A)-hydroxylase